MTYELQLLYFQTFVDSGTQTEECKNLLTKNKRLSSSNSAKFKLSKEKLAQMTDKGIL